MYFERDIHIKYQKSIERLNRQATEYLNKRLKKLGYSPKDGNWATSVKVVMESRLIEKYKEAE
jgi:hypothetical protein